jgi:hypothetical protein
MPQPEEIAAGAFRVFVGLNYFFSKAREALLMQ